MAPSLWTAAFLLLCSHMQNPLWTYWPEIPSCASNPSLYTNIAKSTPCNFSHIFAFSLSLLTLAHSAFASPSGLSQHLSHKRAVTSLSPLNSEVELALSSASQAVKASTNGWLAAPLERQEEKNNSVTVLEALSAALLHNTTRGMNLDFHVLAWTSKQTELPLRLPLFFEAFFILGHVGEINYARYTQHNVSRKTKAVYKYIYFCLSSF